ncbi:MAG: 16S rRNA (cytosine(967)-C(5))-methyltransferase RsmB [Gammaproteobacteria bacterium]
MSARQSTWPLTNARAVAARLVSCVMAQGQSLTACMPASLSGLRDPRDRGLAQELAYGAMRWFPALESLVNRLLSRPHKELDSAVFALLLIGLYQLLYLRIPDHAAVSATVDASRQLGRARAAPLVNAVLRAFLKRRDTLLAEPTTEAAQYAHPVWLLAALKTAWPESWKRIAAANNERPPMTLRVNVRCGSREDYLARLAQSGFEAQPLPLSPSAIALPEILDVSRLPGFDQGHVSVQDGGAQLAALLLDALPGHRILDACAAPGGKCGHILELCPELRSMVAVDCDPARIATLRATLERLRMRAEIYCGDVSTPTAWWDGKAFDRILLDVPCSGSGVIRRHPDIKLLRRESDVAASARLQTRLLTGLWPLLAKSGKLLYVTCSVLPAENQTQIRAFLARHADAHLDPIALADSQDTGVGLQILPGDANTDGFFYALLRKV